MQQNKIENVKYYLILALLFLTISCQNERRFVEIDCDKNNDPNICGDWAIVQEALYHKFITDMYYREILEENDLTKLKIMCANDKQLCKYYGYALVQIGEILKAEDVLKTDCKERKSLVSCTLYSRILISRNRYNEGLELLKQMCSKKEELACIDILSLKDCTIDVKPYENSLKDACYAGSELACLKVADRGRHFMSKDKKSRLAIELVLKEYCDKGGGQSCYWLGEYSENFNASMKQTFMKKACSKNIILACMSAKHSENKHKEYLKDSCLKNNAISCMAVDNDNNSLILKYKQRACLVGFCNINYNAVDIQLNMIKESCDNGHIYDCYKYAYNLDDPKKLNTKEKQERLLKYYKKACDSGVSKACYGLAYMYSLRSKLDKSLNYLKLSFEYGYKNLKHIKNDSDLDNIRHLPKFKQIIETYFGQEYNNIP
jgi:TPR repeat protein